ncbi:membrane protein, partial [Mycobacterium avium subsp. hominissuis 10-5606]
MLLPLHIFVMESLAWTSPRARAAVGASGTAAILLGHKAIGVCAGVGSRAAAAVPPVGLRGAG